MFGGIFDKNTAEKMNANRDELERLAGSADTAKLEQIAGKDLQAAVQRGDATEMQRAFKALLGSKEGAALVEQISKLIK